MRDLACSNDQNYRHDFNDDLGPGTAFPDWEGIEDKWSRYASDVFRAREVGDGEDANDEGEDADPRPQMKVKKGKKKTQVTLQAIDDGIPQLPTILDFPRTRKTGHIAGFCNIPLL